MIESRMLSRLVLRETRLRQFLDLSSSFGNACALNLGRNQQSRTPICKLIPQGERCNLNKIASFTAFVRFPFVPILCFLGCQLLVMSSYACIATNISHLEWRHRYSALLLCINDLVH